MRAVDKNPAYPVAIQELKEGKYMPKGIQLRQVRYLNNIVEQDHRFIKKRVRSMFGTIQMINRDVNFGLLFLLHQKKIRL
ncbi:hypothetical protein BACERE00198_05311 [Bacillus cereus]|uniref:DDE domain-containing protein n=1 Tax=Bacillus thuringiensis TaxID=1428 RepID=A0A9X5MYG3_BACTU|nr:hypothetical protein BTGOE4_59580 [Bacillus thuringiensis]SME73672.1 hypothetical protein BACERE00198_05311 [Bacillus cereus]